MRDGLTALGLSGKAPKPGDLWVCDDEDFAFTEVQPGTARTQHETRMALVIDGEKRCADATLFSLLVAPVTSQTRYASPYRHPLAKGQGGLSRDGLVLLDQLQPVPRKSLMRVVGTLTPAEIKMVRAVLLRNLGIV